jgi:hypothetical protein
MMRVLFWKEYREHRSIWLAMAATAVILLVGVSQLMTTSGSADTWSRAALAGAAVVLAWTYGMVCGGMLLAGERENHTLSFLDILPVRRAELWWGKCLVGVLLVLTQAVVLAGLTIGLNLYSGPLDLALALLMLACWGLIGLAWGLLFSADGHNVLLVVGLAIATQVLVVLGLAVLIEIVVFLARVWFHVGEEVRVVAIGGALLGMGALPLWLSGHLFRRPDRLRRPDRFAPDGSLAISRGGYPVRATVWLTWQQMRALALGLLLFSILAGFVMLAPNPLVWPAATLFFGVLCGVTVFGDEQMFGSRRFLGDQRFPLGRLWLTKLLMRLGLCLLVSFVMFLPSAIRAAGEVGRPATSFSPPRPGLHQFFAAAYHLHLLGAFIPTLQYLLLGLLYGFSLGHLCGLLFRRSIVSAVLALGSSSLLLSVWLPSLVCGGLHLWQPIGVPLVALVASRLLLAPWSADRVVSRRPLVTLAGCLGVMALWIAGGLSYRVLEPPAAAEPFDVAAYSSSLPSFDENKAMQHFRTACAGVLSREHALEGNLQEINLQTQHVAQRGWTEKWPPGMKPLDPWLDKMFAGEWARDLAHGADQPVGVMDDPRLYTLGGRLSFQSQGLSEIANLLVCQGLHRQAQGDPAAFVEYLRQGLALARTLQNKTIPAVASQGHSCERVLWLGLERWLEKLKGHRELIAQVLRMLNEHEAAGRTALTDQVHSDYLVLRNTLEQMPELLPTGVVDQLSEEERKAYTWSLLMPWEHARQMRILNGLYRGDNSDWAYTEERRAYLPLGSALYIWVSSWDRVLRSAQMRECYLQAMRQLVALRLYQEETGSPATSLEALVPKYFSSLPADPLASQSQPFRYHLSDGEVVELNEGRTMIEGLLEQGQPGLPGQAPEVGMGGGAPVMPPPGPGGPRMPPMGRAPARQQGQFVPAGQGILWSAGGFGSENMRGLRRRELTWLVPLPPK